MTAQPLVSPRGRDRSESSPRPVATAVGLTVALVGALVLVVLRTAPAPTGARTADGAASFIVQARPGHVNEAARAVQAAGGTVGRLLPLVDGFEARMADQVLPALQGSPWLRAVTPNQRARFEEYTYDATTSLSNFAKTSGATAAWSQGYLGDGVGVAVVDTGVSPMNDFAGRLVHGPDLSGEGSVFDSYGHGTVMAGIIGGSGADSAGQAGGAYTGVAPKARLVSVKVSPRNGSVDVSTMLQAMHWVSAYKDQYNIRVLNLSWGTLSTQSPTVDPLNYAVERLWRQGIVVVVAAGNRGPTASTMTKPGDDPLVITAGALDDKSNLDPADDSVAPWSSRGPTAAGLAKPDVIASGRTLVAARSYGSKVEADNPKALVSPSYVKGSGTSEAAAVVSGAAAVLLQARPSLTPDQVKSLLTRTASPLAGVGASDQGTGRIQLAAALTADPGPASYQQASASGLGSIEASRGGMNVQTDCRNDGTVDLVKGEIDVRCEAWDPAAWTGTAWTGTAWTGTAWTGTAWTGTAWTGTAWTGGVWSGTAWTGTAWTGTAWTGTAWTGSTWSGTAWTGTAWTTAEYEEVLFSTAFWGNRPPPGRYLPGEAYERVEGTLLVSGPR